MSRSRHRIWSLPTKEQRDVVAQQNASRKLRECGQDELQGVPSVTTFLQRPMRTSSWALGLKSGLLRGLQEDHASGAKKLFRICLARFGPLLHWSLLARVGQCPERNSALFLWLSLVVQDESPLDMSFSLSLTSKVI